MYVHLCKRVICRNASGPVVRDEQAGFSLLFIIGAILAISSLAAGILSMTQSSVYNELNALALARARAVALSGYNYIVQGRDLYLDVEGQTFTISDSEQFTVVQASERLNKSFSDIWVDLEIIGTVNKGTANEANYVLEKSFKVEDPGAITFGDDFEDFDPMVSDPDKDPITKDTANNKFTIGNEENYSFGAMYYTGSKELNWNDNICTNGSCEFELGFRLFFCSSYETNVADGIVFTWFNAEPENDNQNGSNNPIYPDKFNTNEAYASVGGDSSMGEMIGYAGDGRYYSSSNGSYGTGYVAGWLDPERNGIQPPKMGIEFDNFWNDCYGACSNGTWNAPRAGSRCDDRGKVNHIAYVFWGNPSIDANDEPFQCAYYWTWSYSGNKPYQTERSPATGLVGGEANWEGTSTYDDNEHGEGLNQTKSQCFNNSEYCGYAAADFDWEGNPFAFRAEVERSPTANANGKYNYTITSWVRQCRDRVDCKDYADTDNTFYRDNPDDKYRLRFSDTGKFLCHDTNDINCTSDNYNAPTLYDVVELSATEHEMFTRMMFGFTEATGGSTQKATYWYFILRFIKKTDYTYEDDHVTIKNRRRVHKYQID